MSTWTMGELESSYWIVHIEESWCFTNSIFSTVGLQCDICTELQSSAIIRPKPEKEPKTDVAIHILSSQRNRNRCNSK